MQRKNGEFDRARRERAKKEGLRLSQSNKLSAGIRLLRGGVLLKSDCYELTVRRAAFIASRAVFIVGSR